MASLRPRIRGWRQIASAKVGQGRAPLTYSGTLDELPSPEEAAFSVSKSPVSRRFVTWSQEQTSPLAVVLAQGEPPLMIDGIPTPSHPSPRWWRSFRALNARGGAIVKRLASSSPDWLTRCPLAHTGRAT